MQKQPPDRSVVIAFATNLMNRGSITDATKLMGRVLHAGRNTAHGCGKMIFQKGQVIYTPEISGSI